MDSRELRIGNYHIWDGIECKVEADALSSMFYGGLKPKPIPLTKEWLVKFGFEIYGGHWSNGSIRMLISPTVSGGDIILSPYLGYALEIKHVHQLQNLFYALTQKELEIK